MYHRTWEEYSYEEFKLYFPVTESNVVEWRPRRDLEELILYLEDGSTCIYDCINNSMCTIHHEIDIYKMEELDWYEEFRRALRRRMYVERISQSMLSDMTNISQSQISRFVNGRLLPSAYESYLIAKALRCKIGDLLLCD